MEEERPNLEEMEGRANRLAKEVNVFGLVHDIRDETREVCEDVPVLVAEVRRLREENERLEREAGKELEITYDSEKKLRTGLY